MSNGNRRTHGFDPRLFREFRPPNPNNLDMIPFAGPEIYNTSNGPHNPVWSDNMRRIEEMNNMDEYEIEAANMATSDEEEEPKVKPPWDDIPFRLRMEMIASAAGDDTKIERALFHLKLTSAQFHAAAADYRRYLEEDDEDDANISKHQHLMHEALLNGHKAYSTPEGFEALASVHLYKNVGRPEAAVKRPDVDIAKAYMTYCRLDTAFLDSYLPPPRPSTASTGPAACTGDEHADDTQCSPPGSASQHIAIDDTMDPSTSPDPSTPVPPTLSNGAIPQISLTPVAQRHQTPTALSPVPLRLGTPVDTQAVTRSPDFNPSSSRQSTNSTIEVDVDGKGPLPGLRASLLTANRNLENGNAIPSSSSPPVSQEPAPGPTTQLPYTPLTPSQPSNGNIFRPHRPSPQSDSDPPPKRKKPSAPKKKLPAATPSNGASENAQAPTNGTEDLSTNGGATTWRGPLPYKNSAQQPAFTAPVDATGGPVQQMMSSTTEEREEWARRNVYGGNEGRGLGNGFAVRTGNGMNGNANGNENGNGMNENENGNPTDPNPVKKKPGRHRKPKA
ncbi:MAG: hypothetical protein L6R42_006072 [Xanthoria sp. 1 TBL-2021]|nr:MAG: hypothetical protein L6R42_006072 [Xanthoria sp. 1 TBL-2021]